MASTPRIAPSRFSWTDRRFFSFTAAESRDYPTAGFLNLRMHLDHVYSSPALEWLDFADTKRFGEPGAFSGLSDHVPLIARLRVP